MEDFVYRARPWAITLVIHNGPVILGSMLAVIVAMRAIVRPTRSMLLLLYGLLTFIVAFEYQKHGTRILGVTSDYLFSVEHNPGPRQVSQFFLQDVLPPALYAASLVLLILPTARSTFAVFARMLASLREGRSPRPATTSTVNSVIGANHPEAEAFVHSTRGLLIVPRGRRVASVSQISAGIRATPNDTDTDSG